MTDGKRNDGDDSGTFDSPIWNPFRFALDTFRGSLILKFVFAFLLILILITAVGYSLHTQSSEAVKEDVKQKLTLQAESESESIGEWLESNRVPARIISDNGIFANRSEDVGKHLSSRLDKLPDEIAEIHWADLAQRRILESTTPELVDTDFSDSPWNPHTFSFNSFDDVLVSDPYTNTRNETVMAFISAVRERPNTVIVLVVDVSEVNDRFASPIDGTFTQVVDSRGTVIISKNQSQTLKPYIEEEGFTSRAVEQGIRGQSGFLEEDPKEIGLGEDYVISYAPVRGIDWVVVKHAPADEAYGLSSQITTTIALFIGVVLVGVVAIGVTMGFNIVSSVGELSSKARKIEKGDYKVDLWTRRKDEIGTLYSSFASMRDSLHERLVDSEIARREAEEARRELEEANEELEEQKVIISVLNRILRHNLRNSMNVISGSAGIIAEVTSEKEAEKHADIIKEETRTLIEKAEKARSIEELVESDDWEMERMDIVGILEDEIEAYRREYPGAEITADLPGELLVTAYEPVGIALSIIIENSIIHNDKAVPQVHVSLSEDESPEGNSEGWVKVEVADNGPGIPEQEIEVIEKRRETQLRHGSGFGLWIANWIVDRLNGEIQFDEREPSGTVVTVVLPAPESAVTREREPDEGQGSGRE